MLPPPFTCYWPEESPVTQPCHLVEVWRFNSLLVNRNLPYNYHPHLGRRLPCNICHLFLPAEDNTPPHFCTLICEGITILFPGSGRGLEVSAGFYLIENPWSMLTLMVPQGKVPSSKRQIEPHPRRKSHPIRECTNKSKARWKECLMAHYWRLHPMQHWMVRIKRQKIQLFSEKLDQSHFL